MGTLRGRPLACACLLFAGVGIAYALAPAGSCTGLFAWLLSGIVLLGLLGLGVCRLLFRQSAPGRRYLAFLLAFLLLALGWFSFFDGVLRSPVRSFVRESAGEPVVCRGLTVDVIYEEVYGSRYTVEVTLPDGKKADAVLCAEGLLPTGGLSVGDRFLVRATVSLLSEQVDGDDTLRTCLAQGCLLYLSVPEEEAFAEITERNVVTPRLRLQSERKTLAKQIRKAVGGEAGELAAALVVGERSGLSGGTVLDFRRVGASHLLALSGFHLTVLVGMFDLLFRFFRLPFLFRKWLEGVFAVGYCLLTGAQSSTLRATVMLLFLFLAGSVGRKSDPVTVLSLFLAGVFAVRPEAVYDMGMWLSVLATFAMVETAPRLLSRKPAPEVPGKRMSVLQKAGVFLYRKTLQPLGVTFCVLLVTALPMWLAFGKFSVLSPLSTLLLTPLVIPVLYAGILLVPVSAAGWSGGTAWLGGLIGKSGGWVLNLAHSMAEWQGIEISAGTTASRLFGVLLAGILAVVCLFRWKHPRRALYLFLAWTVCFCLVNQIAYGMEEDRFTLTCGRSSDGESEVLAFCEQNGAILLDFTDGSYTAYRALTEEALPESVTEIRAVCLTHYHKRHIATLQKLADAYLLRSLWLPVPASGGNEEDVAAAQVARTLVARFADSHTTVHFYVPDAGAAVAENFSVERVWSLPLSRSTHPVLGVRMVCGEEKLSLAWIGASFWEAEGSEPALESMAESQILLLGGHGPVRKEPSAIIPAWKNLQTVFVCDANALSYFRLSRRTDTIIPGTETVFLPYTELSSWPLWIKRQ